LAPVKTIPSTIVHDIIACAGPSQGHEQHADLSMCQRFALRKSQSRSHGFDWTPPGSLFGVFRTIMNSYIIEAVTWFYQLTLALKETPLSSTCVWMRSHEHTCSHFTSFSTKTSNSDAREGVSTLSDPSAKHVDNARGRRKRKHGDLRSRYVAIGAPQESMCRQTVQNKPGMKNERCCSR
jgi:hypothetical protein